MTTDLISENWALILLTLLTAADVIVSLTPSKKDDQVVGYLSIIVRALSGKSKKKNG